MLPDFLVIGAFKSGTTSLHHYLGQHPEIFMSQMKEPNFFAYNAAGQSQIQRPSVQFPVTTYQSYIDLFEAADQGQRKGEVSPYYLHSEIAPERIRETIPSTGLIASLRDPVKRAYSHYLMHYRTGKTVLSPAEAFDEGGFWKEASLYSEAIRRYQALFSEEQIKIILYEDLMRDANQVMEELFDWLNVSRYRDLNTSYKHNPGGIPRWRLIHRVSETVRLLPVVQNAVPARLRKLLARLRDTNLGPAPLLAPDEAIRWRQYYLDDIHRTEDVIERDLSNWLKGESGS